MPKKIFKGSAMLNPVPAVLVTSKSSKGEVNIFTVGWIGTAVQTQTPFNKLVVTHE